MKYARCPNCNGRLGIPDKKRGRPINCPKCDTEFIAPDHLDSSTKSKNTAQVSSSSEPPVRSKPSLRALPLPTSIADPAVTSPGLDLTPPEDIEASVDLTPQRPASDPLMPPKSKKNKSETVNTSPPDSALDPPGTKSSTPVSPKSDPTSTATPNGSSPLPVARLISPEPQPPTAEPTASAKSSKTKRSVATIIKTESIQQVLTKDGKLPTLQLDDDHEPKPKEEAKSNPALLVAVVGASLLSSIVMMLMLSTDSSQREDRIEQTRQQIRVFYEVRPDQEIKPYQTDLRQAQLAHSRGDFRTEIRAYETVMARFRDENFDQYSGLTGSQNSDRELEKWVSTLLDEAKRNAK